MKTLRSLNDWLRADIKGTVKGVKGGDDAITDEQWASLVAAAEERRISWPKTTPPIH